MTMRESRVAVPRPTHGGVEFLKSRGAGCIHESSKMSLQASQVAGWQSARRLGLLNGAHLLDLRLDLRLLGVEFRHGRVQCAKPL